MRPSEVKNSSETSNILRGVYPCSFREWNSRRINVLPCLGPHVTQQMGWD